MERPKKRSGKALLVGCGILLSRISGFARDRVIAHWFGVGPHADVFATALRGPNILQNLLGEQSISASFIPVYVRLREGGRAEDAGRFAGVVFSMLAIVAFGIALLGTVMAEPIVAVLAPGYVADAATSDPATVDRFSLAVTAIRILFPMTALLVLSAWTLGVLNSHQKFFVSYAAPVLWNAAIITAIFVVAFGYGAQDLDSLLVAACAGALFGGLLQFGSQLPFALRCLRGFRLSLNTRIEGFAEARRNLGPMLLGRGVIQLSAYFDVVLASLLSTGAVAALTWAQRLYILPISLFGMSIAAAELPSLSALKGEDQREQVQQRVRRALDAMLHLTLPTATFFCLHGDLVVGIVYQTGAFDRSQTLLVAVILGAYALGIVTSTTSRLLQNLFFAMGDTKTPARVASARVLLSAAVGLTLMYGLEDFGLRTLFPTVATDFPLGVLGLAIGASVASYFEWITLRLRARRFATQLGLPLITSSRIAASVALGILCSWAARIWALPAGAWWNAFAVSAVFGLVYAVALYALRDPLLVHLARRYMRVP